MKSNFFDTFNDFGNVCDLVFNNFTLDQKPVCWKKDENGYKAVCRTVGVSPEDIHVELIDNGIKLYGETLIDDDTYDVSYVIPISQSLLNNIIGIKYHTTNGLTFIYIEIEKQTKKPVIKIDKI